MFEAKLGTAQFMKKIVDAIKDLIENAPFDVSDNGISLQAMDSSHVALVSLRLESHGFELFRCDRGFAMAMSMANLAKPLKCAASDDVMTIIYEDDQDTIKFKFDSKDRDKMQEYNVKLMDIDQENLGIPDQKYGCYVSMPSADFKKTCADLALFTESLNICATKNSIQFSGKGDSGTSKVTFGQYTNVDNSDENVSIELDEPVDVTFAIKYMKHFANAAGLSPKVNLSISNNVPIVVEFPIEEMGYLRFYLAPKIGDEDEAADDDADR